MLNVGDDEGSLAVAERRYLAALGRKADAKSAQSSLHHSPGGAAFTHLAQPSLTPSHRLLTVKGVSRRETHSFLSPWLSWLALTCLCPLRSHLRPQRYPFQNRSIRGPIVALLLKIKCLALIFLLLAHYTYHRSCGRFYGCRKK
jgi:hypothetical protein